MAGGRATNTLPRLTLSTRGLSEELPTITARQYLWLTPTLSANFLCQELCTASLETICSVANETSAAGTPRRRLMSLHLCILISLCLYVFMSLIYLTFVSSLWWGNIVRASCGLDCIMMLHVLVVIGAEVWPSWNYLWLRSDRNNMLVMIRPRYQKIFRHHTIGMLSTTTCIYQGAKHNYWGAEHHYTPPRTL